MNREAFEKIPKIAKLIEDSGAFYCSKGDWYLCPDELDFDVENYLDGAWMMYCYEQDRVSKVLADVRSYVKDGNVVDAIGEILQ